MSVPIGTSKLELDYKGPTDSMSLIYGNGYDKCGPRRYTYMDLWGINEFKMSLFETDAILNAGFADDFSMSLLSEKTGTTLTANTTLHIDLELYPSSTPAIFEVGLTYRECFPADFSGPFIEDQTIMVG